MNWIVGQLKGAWNPAGTLWQFMGLYSTEARADAACFDRNYFLFRPRLNHPIPPTTIFPGELAGFRFPRRTQSEQEQTQAPCQNCSRINRLFDFGDVAFLHVQNKGNAGDWFSQPSQYFDLFRGCRVKDIQQMTPVEVSLLGKRIVVGGGGLLGRAKFSRQFSALFERTYRAVVGWGIGDNMTVDFKNHFVPKSEIQYPDMVEYFSLLGVRDWGTAFRWVPCSSCLHPAFDKPRVPVHDMVVYESKFPLAIEGFPKRSNVGLDLDAILDFLGSGQIVITNSYHGAYWAQLLGRGVLALPNSSKFWHMKHKMTLCAPGEWKQYLDRVEAQPPALEECRRANYEFKNMAMTVLAQAA